MLKRTRRWLVVGILTVAATLHAHVGDESLLATPRDANAFPLVKSQHAAPIFISENDWQGVKRAAADVQTDIERVSGVKPALHVDGQPADRTVLIAGTVGRSAWIDGLIASGKLDATRIAGKWEAFLITTIEHPLPDVDRALVIVGSDKRGTIYGLYELSEQIGVSPWNWWADVPVKPRAEIFLRAGTRTDRGPVVKYRGIFLNDEAPALTGWAKEKFGGFNHQFYAKVFELLLRLRANYLWPAMWKPQAFNADDALNPQLADEYGIVMGTSHHEPMMRAHDEWERFGQGAWDYAKNAETLREFWRSGLERTKNFEQIVTVGMRGDGDEAMSADANTALLERIVADQRTIINSVTGKPAAKQPQLWALYKEVQDYYEKGMRVPDDVTLLWCDDNWGNLRRLPTSEERKRTGGAGVYYHFDYVGGPRNYKWLNVTPLPKIWEQLHLAWQYDAYRIWIVNVGDLKPMEYPIEFFLTYAWNPARWPYEKLDEYSRVWAAREFGGMHAAEVATLINSYAKLNRHRTPELLAPDTYSLTNYREAERILTQWRELVARAEKLNAELAPEFRDAFFQLVLYPVKASAGVHELYIATGYNRLYAKQGRAEANVFSAQARKLFAADRELVKRYHALGGGKWNHFMDQIKFGYTYWQTPDIDAMPAVQEVQPRAGASLGVSIEGLDVAWPAYGAPAAVLPELVSSQGDTTRWVELFNRGDTSFGFQARTDQPWVKLSTTSGEVAGRAVRLEVGVDWTKFPAGSGTAEIILDGGAAGKISVRLPARKMADGAYGFIEVDQHVAINATNYDRAVQSGEITWQKLPDFGRGAGGVTAFPVTMKAVKPNSDSPRLEYVMHTVSAGEVSVEVQLAPSLDFQPGEALRYGISFNDEAPQIVPVSTWTTLTDWETAVSDSVRRVVTRHQLKSAGPHMLKFWLVTPGVVVERLIVNFAPVSPGAVSARDLRVMSGVRPSYLGPPESPRIRPTPKGDQAVMRADRNSQIGHEQLLVKAKAGGIDLYFLGDSITRRWGATDYPEFLAHWKKSFFGWNAADFGWGGDTTQNIIWRLENGELDGVNPKVIVLLAGTNNIGRTAGDDAKVDEVTDGIEAILRICRAKAPNAKFILMGIFPRNDGPATPTINRINENLAKFADGKPVRYVSINDQLADAQGKLYEGMTVDKLHLTLKGYEIWGQALYPILREWLGAPADRDTAPPPTGDPSVKVSN